MTAPVAAASRLTKVCPTGPAATSHAYRSIRASGVNIRAQFLKIAGIRRESREVPDITVGNVDLTRVPVGHQCKVVDRCAPVRRRKCRPEAEPARRCRWSLDRNHCDDARDGGRSDRLSLRHVLIDQHHFDGLDGSARNGPHRQSTVGLVSRPPRLNNVRSSSCCAQGRSPR